MREGNKTKTSAGKCGSPVHVFWVILLASIERVVRFGQHPGGDRLGVSQRTTSVNHGFSGKPAEFSYGPHVADWVTVSMEGFRELPGGRNSLRKVLRLEEPSIIKDLKDGFCD